VRFLLAAGADAGAVAGSALYEACIGGHVLVAEALLDAGGTLTSHHRNHALHFAALYGRTACCALMLDRGADINSRPYGVDALCSAAQHGHRETVALLLDRGADAWSEEAMQGAAERHHNAVVALLLALRGGGAAQ
jgi:ankyrin repeat protein